MLAVLMAALVGVAVAPGAASAADRDGSCDSGDFCYYYNSDQAGSVSDFTDTQEDYGATQPSCFEFKGDGAGKGVCVKNNAASVWNRTSKTVRVYFNSNLNGAHQDFDAGEKANLNATLKNNNASHELLGSSTNPTGCQTDGTNTTLPSTILVYRASQGRVDRVDFKTYVKNVLPNEWIGSWPNASLDAGAVAVKNFAWYWALHSTRKTSGGQCFDVYDNTNSQVYKPGSAQTATSAAVDRTWSSRITRSGKIFEAHYCANTTACRPGWVDGDWMSQTDSANQARQGKNFREILQYWYRNVAVS
ncbi:peptidase inhibitor family I36 protein [Actinoplanes sp. NPDC049118]|uniref:peptidase inhibitor family I36 protein n=1 Tax=Actinoplanes sp. NPDC049118 TaxID=3155769 RepID=UPI0033EEFEE6